MTPIIRILLRVLAGFLIAKGLPPDVADLTKDPELALTIETAIGGLVLVASEGWYALAKRFGWRT